MLTPQAHNPFSAKTLDCRRHGRHGLQAGSVNTYFYTTHLKNKNSEKFIPRSNPISPYTLLQTSWGPGSIWTCSGSRTSELQTLDSPHMQRTCSSIKETRPCREVDLFWLVRRSGYKDHHGTSCGQHLCAHKKTRTRLVLFRSSCKTLRL